ncbi:MAG: metal-sulfur cluster assembly factor [Deltaproteobacteria bacterium]|nr:metal-sulfur cluster assembly factor [Deltaproteobacteria bacterium]
MVTRDQVIEVLKTVEDPEIFLDIWFLGLIYSIDIQEDALSIDLTFTTPLCPAGPMIVDEVKTKLLKLEGVKTVDVKVVFTPPWQPSDEVKAMLGMI